MDRLIIDDVALCLCQNKNYARGERQAFSLLKMVMTVKYLIPIFFL